MLTAVGLVAVAAAGCTASGPGPERDDGPASASAMPTESGPAELTLAVYGAKPQLAAYRDLAEAFMDDNPAVDVTVQGARTAGAAQASLERQRQRGDAPDVFLIEDQWLPALVERGEVRPLNELLEQRQVNFGDGYQRDGLEMFSAESALQCMPHDVSPMVVYYNSELVDFTTLTEDDEEPITAEDGWSWQEFRAAAEQSAQGPAKGVYIEPSLHELAPFIWSASGELVDDNQDPSTLTLSDGDTQSALELVLNLVREPRLTFTPEQLARRDALTRFKDGQLGMILGSRELTPALRAADELNFEVFPLPRIGSMRTITNMSGYCISPDTESLAAAADLVAFAVSNTGATITTEPGYVMPSNLQVSHSTAFTQPGEMPRNSFVFNEGVRRSEFVPFVPTWTEMRTVAQPYLHRLFYDPVIDLEASLLLLDARSQSVFGDPAADEDAR